MAHAATFATAFFLLIVICVSTSTSHDVPQLTTAERMKKADRKKKMTEALKKRLAARRAANEKRRRRFRRSFIRTGLDAILRRRLKRILIHKCGRHSYRFRRVDGSCNHWRNVKRGAAGTPFRLLTWRGMRKAPTGRKRPSARVVSNIVHHDAKTKRNRRRMSEMVVFMGQFLDHTIAETENDEKKKFNIKVPKNDKFFKGTKYIKFVRSIKKKTRRGYAAVNMLPSYVDLAVTYGAHKEAAEAIRRFKNGELKTSATKLSKNMLPQDKDNFFMSGDRRVNENPSLTAMHTLWMRNHNKLCREVKKGFPFANDEFIFNLARKVNEALFQSVIYYEFLPTVLGRRLLFWGPRHAIAGIANPTLSDEFAVMAYRVGHTMVNDHMTFIRKNGSVRKRLLSSVFFRPDWFKIYTIEDCFRGMMKTRAAEVDVQVASQLRNFLFAKTKDATPQDLVSLNIQRGRDNRLPSYVKLRRRFGLRPITRFSQITKNKRVQRALKRAYGHVERIDGFTGGLAEDHCCGGSLGPLFRTIWIREFGRLRAGDRFYFEKKGSFKPVSIRRLPTLRKLLGGKLRGKTLKFVLRGNTDIKPKDLKNIWRA